jgi:hypothetical protein
MRRKNDILWKGIIEEVFDDLLRFIFPEADKVFDIGRGFEFMDKELAKMYPEPEKESDTKFVDKLVKAFRKDGQEEWVLCHVEIQGETKAKERSLFAERMFLYYCRIFERGHKPITAIAIFTALDGCKMPDRYEYHFLGTSHTYEYNTYRIADASNKELAKSDNPFAVVVMAAKTALLSGKVPELELKNKKLLIAKLLLGKKVFPKKKVDAILAFLNNYVLFAKKETNHIFMEELDQLTGQTNTMGIIEQLADIKEKAALKKGEEKVMMARTEGEEKVKMARTEGERKVKMTQEKSIKAFLDNTGFSVEKIASLVDVPVSFVEKVKRGIRAK